MKKILALIGLATVAAGVGAAIYKHQADEEGLSLEQKLRQDKYYLSNSVREKREIALLTIREVKKDLDRNTIKIIHGLEEGLLILADLEDEID